MSPGRHELPSVLVILSDLTDAGTYFELLHPYALRVELAPARPSALGDLAGVAYAAVIVQILGPGPAVGILADLRAQCPRLSVIVAADSGHRPALADVPILDEPPAAEDLRRILQPILDEIDGAVGAS